MLRAANARGVGFLAAGTLSLFAVDAQATRDEEACFTAAANGQRERNQGSLLRARSEFERCSSPKCDPKVVNRCSEWLHRVIESTPTIVLSAKDEGLHDLADVRVYLDGSNAPAVTKGAAIPVNPGAHEVRFVKDGSAAITQSVVVHEGEKARLVQAVFPAHTAPSSKSTRPVPLTVYLLGGAGLFAAGVATWFTVVGLNDRASFGCAVACSEEEARSTRRSLLVADISGAMAIAALGTATWLYLTRPLVTVSPGVGGISASLSARF